MAEVSDLCHLLLNRVKSFVALADNTLAVAHCNVLNAHIHKVLRNRDTCRACAVHNYLYILNLLADNLKRVKQSCGNNNSSAVLVVVENRNIANFLKSLFNLKAPRSGNVLEVNSAERAANHINCVYNLVNALASYANREGVNITERLKQRAFTLHNRHTCLRTDIS